MAYLKSPMWVTGFVFVVAVVVGFGDKSRPVQAQELERVLEIERYPGEPLALVNLRIGTQSVRDHIKQKFKDNHSKWTIESVSFNEKDDWVKRLSITFRNASDKPVYGVQGSVFFKPLGYPMMFSFPLTHSVQSGPLQPGAEIELSVDESRLNQALEEAKKQGADLRGAVVSLSLDTVIFSKELRWYRGAMLRPDSEVPNKWVPVGQSSTLKQY